MLCRKPPKERIRCKVSKPSGFSAHTEPVQLIDVPLSPEESADSTITKRSEELKYEVIRDIKTFSDAHNVNATDFSKASNIAIEIDVQQQPACVLHQAYECNTFRISCPH